MLWSHTYKYSHINILRYTIHYIYLVNLTLGFFSHFFFIINEFLYVSNAFRFTFSIAANIKTLWSYINSTWLLYTQNEGEKRTIFQPTKKKLRIEIERVFQIHVLHNNAIGIHTHTGSHRLYFKSDEFYPSRF